MSRITLANDRVARVVRGPDGFAVEHDAARGDVYLRPLETAAKAREALTLFIGTAKGFTYRLALQAVARGSAQILIRNVAAAPRAESPGPGDARVGALVALVRAVARRDLLPGYVIETLPVPPGAKVLIPVEAWRGRRFTAHVYEIKAGSRDDPETLMETLAPGVAALWPAPRGSAPSGGRLLVAVRETYPVGAAQ